MAIASKTFRVGPEPMSRDKMYSWLDAQIPYPNLADDDEVAKRALTFARAHVTSYDQKATEVRKKWEILNHILRVQTVSDMFPGSDLHVPLLYTMLESLVPRIVDPLASQEPWFEVVGRDKKDRERAKRIQLWLEYQNDLTGIRERMEEMARVMCVYQFVLVKNWWDVRYKKKVTRKYEMSTGKDGLPVYKITPERVDELDYEGNCIDIVDPVLAIFDIDQTDPQKMLFIGDRSFVSEAELLRLGEIGRYKNVDQAIKDKASGGGQDTNSMTANAFRRARSLASGPDQLYRTNNGRGGPGMFEVGELWCTWRPTDEDDFEEWIITWTGNTVLRVQKNYRDDGKRPYSLARAANEPFDFFNVGVLDHAIPLNIEIDDHRNLLRKNVAMAGTPIVFVSPDSDVPDNLFDCDVGQVFRSNSPPTVISSRSSIGDTATFESILRQDAERAVGAPDIYTGSGQSNTATEVERKITEGNRRTKRLIVSFAQMLADVEEMFLSNTKQFVTERKMLRVLGVEAVRTGLRSHIGPEDFTDPVDIYIVGLDRLATAGMRSTKLASTMQLVDPLIPLLGQQGQLNIPKLFSELWYTGMGYRLGEDILAIPAEPEDAIHPATENVVLLQGNDVDVNEADEDDDHLAKHESALNVARRMKSDESVKAIMGHMAKHLRQRDSKEARAKRDASPQRGPFQQVMADTTRNAPQDGRAFQRKPDLQGDIATSTPPGEAPGPMTPYSMGAPDRAINVPQTENRA